jgi:hypothetical protein
LTPEIKNKGGRPKKKHAGGRPTVITAEAIRKLEAAFLRGCTDSEACFAADIGRTALYEYQQKNPEFTDRKERLKENPIFLARGVQLEALQSGCNATAQKVIDRKDGIKHNVSGTIQVNIAGKDAGV